MKQRLLSSTVLITLIWLLPLDKSNLAVANQSSSSNLNQEVAINANSNDVGRKLSVMLMIAGAGVFGWYAIRNDKDIFSKQLFSQYQLKHNIPAQRSLSIDQYIKEQTNYYTDTDISTYIKLAYSHFKQGDTQKAIEVFNKAIGFNPHSAYLYGERANFRHKNLGDKQGAIEDYSKAIGIHPQNALFYLWRSQAYKDIGEQRKAIEDYNTAVRLAPESTMYHYFYRAKQ